MPATDKDVLRDDLSVKTQAEHVHKLGRFTAKSLAGILAPVGAGALASELFDLLVADPSAARRDNMLTEIANRILKFEAAGYIAIDDLVNNEDVSAIIIRAVQAAMRSSGRAKFEALRDAAAHGILKSQSHTYSETQIVLNILDRITDHHIVLLKWKSSPQPQYTIGQREADPEGEPGRSLFYGQPVTVDRSSLNEPVTIYHDVKCPIYAERSEVNAYRLAEADLVSMGLLKPIHREEEVRSC